MPPPEVEVTPETVQRHAGALRALAQRLIGDEHAAEDVVQETWLAALAHGRSAGPQGERRGPGPWLRTVARRLSGRRIRTELRREGRERAAAQPEASDDEPARRSAVFAAVTAAILALDEPYRETLLLRFVEDLPPRTIAARLGVPLPTVKSRLARGIERVRVDVRRRLEDEGIDYLGGLALLVGAPHFAPPLSEPTDPGALAGAPETGVLMPKLSLLPLALGASALGLTLAAFSWFAFAFDGEPQDMQATHLTSAPTREVPAPQAAAVARPEAVAVQTVGGARRPVAAEPPAARNDAADPSAVAPEYTLTARLTDQHGLPLAGAELFAAPPSLPLNRVGRTDEAGLLSIRFHGAPGKQPLVLAARASGRVGTRLFSLNLTAGQPHRLDLAFSDEKRAFTTVVLGELDEASGVVHEVNFGVQADFALSSWSAALDDVPRFAANLFFARGPEQITLSGADAAKNEFVAAQEGSLTMDVRFGPAGNETVEGFIVHSLLPEDDAHFTSAVDTKADDTPAALVRGRLSHPDGSPAADLVVRAFDASRGFATEARTDEDGQFTLEALEPGALTLIASASGIGTARTELHLEPGAELRWDAVLDAGRVVAGRLVGADGRPHAQAAVELWIENPAHTWRGVLHTDADGRFRFTGVPDARARLFVRLDGNATQLPDWTREDVWPGELGALEIPAPRRGALELTIQDGDGETVPTTELRLWQESTGTARSAASEPTGTVSLAGLPSGAYRARLGWSNGSWTELDPLWIEPDESLALGPVKTPGAGTLDVRVEPGQEALSLGLWREVGGGAFALVERVDRSRQTTALELVLGPGNYALGIESGDEHAGLRFALARGATLEALVRDVDGVSRIVLDGVETTPVQLPPLPIVTFGLMVQLPSDGK